MAKVVIMPIAAIATRTVVVFVIVCFLKKWMSHETFCNSVWYLARLPRVVRRYRLPLARCFARID